MKRRNFIKSFVAAAVAATVLPVSALRDVFIHRGNMLLPHGVGKSEAFRVLYGAGLRPYQHASRVVFASGRQQGKTHYLHIGNASHSEIEARVIAWLDEKDNEQLKMLTDFEAAEKWRDIIPKHRQ